MVGPGQTPPIRFAAARGARIAYMDFGAGDHTMVAVPPLAQNVEVAWEWHEVRTMLVREAGFARIIPFDKRGTGSSDRTSRVPGIDERVDDMRAVFDAAGVARAHVYGASGGGPTALLFAATYPDRVASVILHGSGARMAPVELTDELRATYRERAEEFVARWGTPDSLMVPRFAPSKIHDQEFRRWHQRYERTAASADSLRELLDINVELDVRGILDRIEVPVLVLHAERDQAVPVELGREVAAGVRHGELHVYDSDDHLQYVGDIEQWMPVLERFITGKVADRRGAAPVRRRVEIATLGRFAVTVDGEEVPTAAWGSRRARQLCKRLIVARGWPVRREELIDLLWPDETDLDRLSARLSVQLSSVRKVLHGGISADRQAVAIDLTEVAIDLEAFHRAASDEEIVAAFTGPLLPDDVYEDWAGPARDEVAARFVTAAKRLADRASDDDIEQATALVRRVLEVDPYDEDAHRRHVVWLHRAGAPGSSRRAHGRWADAMAELGVAVEPFDEVVARGST